MRFERIKIGEIAEVKGGKRLPKGFGVQADPTDHPYLRVVDFDDNGLNPSNIKFITSEVYETIRQYTITDKDIYVSIAGTIGRVGIVPVSFSGANLTENAANITNISDNVYAPYLCYFLKGYTGQTILKSKAGGTSQPKLALYRIAEVEFPNLPLEIQKRIADILSAYDDLIENNRRRIALLERVARELYREWFVRLRFPGHEHTKIVDGVPEGWERIHLSRLVSTQYGYTASASDEPIGPKFLRGTDINKQSYIDWAKVPHCPEDGLDFEKYALRPGDLLVIRMADPGKVAIVEREINAIFASYLVRLLVRSDAEIAPLFLFYVLTDSEYQGFIRAASGGATRKSASAKLLTDFRALRPPEIIQDVFVDQVSPLRKMIGTLLDQNSKASLCRDLLLPRLMSGEVAV